MDSTGTPAPFYQPNKRTCGGRLVVLLHPGAIDVGRAGQREGGRADAPNEGLDECDLAWVWAERGQASYRSMDQSIVRM
jgi:hypothetical protein